MTGINVTVTGNLTDDPELKFTPSGAPVAQWTVAVNERYKDGSGQWQDGPTSYVRCVAWRDLAEHVAESLSKGDRAMVAGTMRERTYEVQSTHTGDTGKRRIWQLNATEVGAALRYATVKIARAQRRGDAPVPEDPWASGPAAPPAEDEPPF
jgi:single-strand DNA-binding protein